ncbi:MAG: alpha/beta hydrolase [Rhodococcus sp.]|nr:alpha/beta hydrolase [Rhodococcus sp. (in: high G+C Gram-positive bacteria)]
MNRIKIRYGEHTQQFGHFYPPADAAGPVPVVVVIHGGFWKSDYSLAVESAFCRDLVEHGVAVWNIEYRRLGAGGHWPEMSADVVAAFNALTGPVADAAPIELDLTQVRVIGHSAGGQLAVWLAGQRGLNMPIGWVVSQAGALDLVTASERGRRISYIEDLFGVSYDDDPQVYRSASPMHRVPIGVPVLCLHGDDDAQVPVSVSRRYADAAEASGDEVVLNVLADTDHFAFLAPGSAAWERSRAAVLATSFAEAAHTR